MLITVCHACGETSTRPAPVACWCEHCGSTDVEPLAEAAPII